MAKFFVAKVSSVKRKAIQMDFNTDKYFVENSHALTEAEKIQFAKDLIELERQGVLEYRDGQWSLAAGVEIEEPLAHDALPYEDEEGSN